MTEQRCWERNWTWGLSRLGQAEHPRTPKSKGGRQAGEEKGKKRSLASRMMILSSTHPLSTHRVPVTAPGKALVEHL